MKMSFFGYNRKETDDYFDYLTKANAELTEQVEQLSAEAILQEFLQEQDIWWNQIKNMEKAEVMWLFMTL